MCNVMYPHLSLLFFNMASHGVMRERSLSKLQILHISDTHFLVDYTNRMEKRGGERWPAEVTAEFLHNFDFAGIDVVAITGDLVHEGTENDYQEFKALLGASIPDDVAVICCIGNHDDRETFRRVFQPGAEAGPVHARLDLNGYRIIALDSTIPGSHHGELGDAEARWLESQLAELPREGAVLMWHHPMGITWRDGLELSDYSPQFERVVAESNVRAILTGHFHMNRSSFFAGVPQLTANPLSFGIVRQGERLWDTNRLGYSVVSIDKDQVDSYNEIIQPAVDILFPNDMDPDNPAWKSIPPAGGEPQNPAAQ